jgi:toxin HigB-1
VIVSFGDATTEDLFNGVVNARTGAISQDVAGRAVRKLDQLNAAAKLDDMKVPPSNRLEKLKGDLAAFWSVRANDQWSVIFRWTDSGPADVKFTDYH